MTDAVCTELYRVVNFSTSAPIACAVCDQLSNSLILGADIVDKLQWQWLLDQSGVCDDVVSCDRDEVALNVNDVRVADDVHADDNNEDGVIDVDDVARADDNSSSSPTDENERVTNTTQLIMEQREDDSLSNG